MTLGWGFWRGHLGRQSGCMPAARPSARGCSPGLSTVQCTTSQTWSRGGRGAGPGASIGNHERLLAAHLHSQVDKPHRVDLRRDVGAPGRAGSRQFFLGPRRDHEPHQCLCFLPRDDSDLPGPLTLQDGAGTPMEGARPSRAVSGLSPHTPGGALPWGLAWPGCSSGHPWVTFRPAKGRSRQARHSCSGTQASWARAHCQPSTSIPRHPGAVFG